MKKAHFILAAVLLLTPASTLRGQVYTVDFNSKVIRTDELNMARSTSIYTVLTMLPELLQRPDRNFYSHYSVYIDGMSVTNVSDAALQQLQILDVESISVSESAIGNYTKNGQAGSINITLRKDGSKEDKATWGNVGVAASYPLALTPSVVLAHRSGSFQVRGMFMGDINNSLTDIETATFTDSKFISSESSRNDSRYRGQLARVYMKYSPSAKDVLSLNMSETFTYDGSSQAAVYGDDLTSSSTARATNVHALLNYSHSFGRSSLTMEAQYLYAPGSTHKLFPEKQEYDMSSRGHNYAGAVKYSTPLLPKDSPYSIKLTTGCNMNAVSTATDMSSIMYYNGNASKYNISPQTNTFFLQPFMVLESTFGKLRVKASAEYQYFRYDITRMEKSYSTPCKDVTATLVGEWRFSQDRSLRLILDRKLDRASDVQLFPARMYYPSLMQYVEGNPDLRSVLSHEVRLDYVSSHKWGEHRLVLDASASYNNVSGIISSVRKGGESNPGSIGLTQQYLSYENNGTDHILNGNFMAFYSYRVLSLSLTGNVYHNKQLVGTSSNHYTYYNLALNSTLNLKDGWDGGVKLVYNSRVTTLDGSLGDNVHTTMTLGKRWKNFYVHVFDRVSLQTRAADFTYKAGDTRIERFYEMVPNVAGIGVRWTIQ